MNTGPQKWLVTTVPIESSGGACVAHRIGPFNACIYDDGRNASRGFTSTQLMSFAYMMSAAPEMLAALKAVVSAHENDDTPGLIDAMTKAELAIHRAEPEGMR